MLYATETPLSLRLHIKQLRNVRSSCGSRHGTVHTEVNSPATTSRHVRNSATTQIYKVYVKHGQLVESRSYTTQTGARCQCYRDD